MTNEPPIGSREEVERIRRISDQLCTAHATLDVVILILSAWVSALAFIDPRLTQFLVPNNIDPQFWIGLIGLAAFCLTLVQMRMDWRGRSEAHKRSFTMYVEVKREAGYLLASADAIPAREFQRLAARYDMASDVGTGVPEAKFLALKRRHKIKVEISKLLDKQSAASVTLTELKLLFRDNWPWRAK
jgi:hypothetical protein